jgi:hypothetical protein
MMPIYAENLITYIDVLGFRQIIEQSKDNEDLCAQVQDQLSQIVDWFGQFGLKDRFHSFSFSDLTVRATRVIDGDDVAERVDREAYYIAERQLQMAMRGWFLRGAIAIGPLAVKDSVIFGPGLVRAYELETTIAVYPRIVINPLLIDRLVSSRSHRWLDYRAINHDGIAFVNYLFGVFLRRFSFPDQSEKSPWKALDDHRKACLAFLDSDSAQDDLRVKQKAVWVSNCHNRVMADLEKRFEGRADAIQFQKYLVDHPDLVM